MEPEAQGQVEKVDMTNPDQVAKISYSHPNTPQYYFSVVWHFITYILYQISLPAYRMWSFLYYWALRTLRGIFVYGIRQILKF